MSARKTPVLLRRGPISGKVNALLRYKHDKTRDLITAHDKQDVTADFDAVMLEMLYGVKDEPPCPDIVYLLDKAAAGEPLDEAEREQMDAFHGRFKAIVDRHNARQESGAPA